MSYDQLLNQLEKLTKTLEAGVPNAAPDQLVQGAALQGTDISPVLHNATWGDAQLYIGQKLSVKPAKSLLVQFNRRLSYGQFGSSAQIEGAVGPEQVGRFVRITVPMGFYSQVRRTSLPAAMVATVNNLDMEETQSADAAMVIAGDTEFDCLRGKDSFSNGGVFDGADSAIPALPNIKGIACHIRQSDRRRDAKDLMFAEYGADDSVTLNVGGVLQQRDILQSYTRGVMNHSRANVLLLDPLTMGSYNEVAFGKERIVLAGSPQQSTGADLRRQAVPGGVVTLDMVRFLSGKTRPQMDPSPLAPAAPALTLTQAADRTNFALNDALVYYATGVNEAGEGTPSTVQNITITAAGNRVEAAVTSTGGSPRYWNLYRSNPGGSARDAKFIGSVLANTVGPTTFIDLTNKIPGFVTGMLLDWESMDIAELSSFSQLDIAPTDLSKPKAFYRFLTLRVELPRRNVILDNLK